MPREKHRTNKNTVVESCCEKRCGFLCGFWCVIFSTGFRTVNFGVDFLREFVPRFLDRGIWCELLREFSAWIFWAGMLALWISQWIYPWISCELLGTDCVKKYMVSGP